MKNEQQPITADALITEAWIYVCDTAEEYEDEHGNKAKNLGKHTEVMKKMANYIQDKYGYTKADLEFLIGENEEIALGKEILSVMTDEITFNEKGGLKK